MRLYLIPLIILSFFTASVSADNLDSSAVILPGSKIKVITKTEKETTRRSRSEYKYAEYTGHYLERLEDAFIIRTNDSIFTIPQSDISLLYTSNKTKMNFGTGFKYGGTIGFVGGAILGLVEGPIQICVFGGCEPPTTSERIGAAVGFGLAFGIAGGLVGGVIGSFIRTDKWEVADADQFQVSIEPVYNDKLGLKLALRF
ncbi:MAG: hypothetical protein DWP97_05625 [Calditrichaeota bacterium]|nr:MAG: hypothetical protein DWP97_05625 [Calditrichota bacterium]